MLFQSIESHARLQNKHDRQWIHTAVAFIKAYQKEGSMDLLSGMIDKDAYITRLVNHIVEAAGNVDSGAYCHARVIPRN